MSKSQDKKIIKIVCDECHETMLIITGKIEVEVKEKNENPYEVFYCEECYRKQKEIVEQIRFLVS